MSAVPALLKRQLIFGWIRVIESTLLKYRSVHTDIIFCIVSYIDDRDCMITNYWQSIKTREIVTIHVGHCGNTIGSAFWDTVGEDHLLSVDGQFRSVQANAFVFTKHSIEAERRLEKIHVYYHEGQTMNFVPRACFIDPDAGVIDKLQASRYGALFKPGNMVFGSGSTGNNWAKGHYTDGAEMIDECMDVIRAEMEACHAPQSVQLTHALGGGSGSGLGSLVLLKLRDQYPDLLNFTFSVYPSPKVSDIVVEPYNAVLSMNHLLGNADATFVLDNESLFHISHNVLKQPQPSYRDLNWVVSRVMCGLTASLRFSGTLNGDCRKMCTNLIPFPRLHFLLSSYAPLYAPNTQHKVRLTAQELTDQGWSSRNFLVNVKSEDGKYLCAAHIYRGDISMQEVEDEIAKCPCKMSDDFITWIPNNVKASVIVVAPTRNVSRTATFVANTTAIKGVFQRILAQFAKIYQRKAFLHWFTAEGMDEMEFQEADKNVRDLITQYQDAQDAVVDLDIEWCEYEEDGSEQDDDEDYDGEENF